MKIGVLGRGSIGERHVDNIDKLGHEVKWHDPNIFASEGRQGILRWADAVVIASPTPYHVEDLRDVIFAGKHALVEKPIGCDERQAAELMYLLREARDRKLTVMTGYNLRFHDCVKQAKAWVDSGCLGKPLWANFTVAQKSEKPEYLRDGVTLNWSHEIDLALYLLGPAQVSAASINDDDSIADIILEHSTGWRSTIHMDYHTFPEIRRFTVAGDFQHASADMVKRISCLVPPDDSPDWWRFDSTWDTDYLDEMQAFIDRIQGKPTLGATGEDGLAVLNICLEAKSHAKASAVRRMRPEGGDKVKLAHGNQTKP